MPPARTLLQVLLRESGWQQLEQLRAQRRSQTLLALRRGLRTCLSHQRLRLLPRMQARVRGLQARCAGMCELRRICKLACTQSWEAPYLPVICQLSRSVVRCGVEGGHILGLCKSLGSNHLSIIKTKC